MFKKLVRKLIYGYKANADDYIVHLRKIGMLIGKDCSIYAPTKVLIDEQYPWMISIGDHVRITQGVIILTHDYSWSVLKRINYNGESGRILGACGKVDIGNNVFIGMNAIILSGVSIGNNVVIGAGSVVTKNCDANCVYAGNPAYKIMSIEEFYVKRINAQIEEATSLARCYFDRNHTIPPKEVFHEFFMLFEDANLSNKIFLEKIKLNCNKDESFRYMENHTAPFKNYDEFIKYCLKSHKKL